MMMRKRFSTLGLTLLLFVTFRLGLLAFWPADQLACWSDYDYYYEIASWVDEGRLPYLHYWVEYPPLFPYLSVALYLLTPHYAAYAGGLALVQLAFEAGSLALLHRLARRALGASALPGGTKTQTTRHRYGTCTTSRVQAPSARTSRGLLICLRLSCRFR